MGVTIRYRGPLVDLEKVNILSGELTQVAEKMDWPYHQLDEDWSKPSDVRLERDERGAQIVGHLGLKGISFKPHPKCESVPFFFDSSGKLCDPMGLVPNSEGRFKPEEAWINVKTQFAGPEIHLWVVGLLKYVKEHYIPGLEVRDEGEFWETGNFEVLKEKMNFLNLKTDEVCGELARVTGRHLERLAPEDVAFMIEILLQNRFSGPEDDVLVNRQYGVGEILTKIETGLKLAGKDINSLTVDDLAPVDEFHTRGRAATREMAEMANLKASDLVLDVGCGLGGTARYLSDHYQCTVKGVDLTKAYIAAGTKLTEYVNLGHRVELRHGSAVDLPYEAELFDIVWTQHVQMNIAAKHRFYSEIARVLKPGGRFIFHDVFRSSKLPPLYPVPWAEDESISALVTEQEARAIIEEMGLAVDQWIGRVAESVKFFERVLTRIEAHGHPPLGIHLILGDNAEDKLRNHARNLSDNRLSVVVGCAHKK